MFLLQCRGEIPDTLSLKTSHLLCSSFQYTLNPRRSSLNPKFSGSYSSHKKSFQVQKIEILIKMHYPIKYIPTSQPRLNSHSTFSMKLFPLPTFQFLECLHYSRSSNNVFIIMLMGLHRSLTLVYINQTMLKLVLLCIILLKVTEPIDVK